MHGEKKREISSIQLAERVISPTKLAKFNNAAVSIGYRSRLLQNSLRSF
jgi:hypothetical protein